MNASNVQFKSFLFSLILIILSVLGWELYLRAQGYKISYDDGKEFWAHKRTEIYLSKQNSTIFIGSSRIKYDLDTDTWLDETGDTPIQLACVGSTPISMLNDLASDEKFAGKLIIDVTEKLFYNFSPGPFSRPKEGMEYYQDETYAQKVSYHIDRFLQTYLVCLDKENFSLNPLIGHIPIPPRDSVRSFAGFPIEFEEINAERQSFMTDRFAADTTETKIVQGIWKSFGKMGRKAPPTPPQKIDSLMADVKIKIDMIKKRGGEVVFTRTPSTGDELMGEKIGFPREKYWQKLLDITQCKGIHYEDFPELTMLKCPEYSHLDRAGAEIFTKKLVSVLRQEHGWKFNKSN